MKKLQTVNGSIIRSYTIGTGAGQLPPGQYRAFFKGDFNSFATLPASYSIGSSGLATDVQKDIRKEQLNTTDDGWNYSVDEDRRFWKDDFSSDTSGNYAKSGGPVFNIGSLTLPMTASVFTPISNLSNGKYTTKVRFDSTATSDSIFNIYFISDISIAVVFLYGTTYFGYGVYDYAHGRYLVGTGARPTTIPHNFDYHTVGIELLSDGVYVLVDDVRIENKIDLTVFGASSITGIGVRNNNHSGNCICSEISYIPSTSYSDSFTSDTSARYQAISGTSAFSTDKLNLIAPASTWNKTRLKSYKYESGKFTQKLILPTTGHEGDIVAHFFNGSADMATNYGVGLKRLASNLWLPVEIKDSAVVTTGTSPIAPLQDGMTAYLEVECDTMKGVSWLSVWKDGTANVMTFDGTNDYVSCGSNSILNTYSAFTIVAQVKFDNISTSSGYKAISARSNPRCYSFRMYNNKLQLATNPDNNSSNWQTVLSNTSLNSNVKYTVGGVYNGTKTYLYLNGIKESNETTITGVYNADSTLELCSASGSSFSNGSIYYVSIFNRALTSQEMLDITNGKHITSGLVAHYVNTGNTSADWVDRSGNGNNGTVSGSPATTSITGSKLTGTTLKQFAPYQLAHTATGFYNAHTADNTCSLKLMESRARSMIGYTNVPASESVSFTDDFNENSIGRFTVATGTPSISGGSLLMRGSSYYCSLYGNNIYGDGEYTFKFKNNTTAANDVIGIWICCNGSPASVYVPQNGYSFFVSLVSGTSYTAEIRKVVNDTTFTTLNSSTVTLTTGSEHTVKGIKSGNSLQMYVNGTLTCTTTDNTFNSGYILLRSKSDTLGAINSEFTSLSFTASRNTYKPMLRGAGIGSYWDGSTEVLCARFTDDFERNSYNEWNSSYVISDQFKDGYVDLVTEYRYIYTKHKFKNGYYEYNFKVVATSGGFYSKFGAAGRWASLLNGTWYKEGYSTSLGSAGVSFTVGHNYTVKIIVGTNTISYQAIDNTTNTVGSIVTDNSTTAYGSAVIGFDTVYGNNPRMQVSSVKVNAVIENSGYTVSGYSTGGFYLNDGNANNTGNWVGLKFKNHDRDATYTNTINVGTSTVTDATGIYYDLVRKNITDNSAISPTKAMTTALPIGTASTQTATDITLNSDDIGDDIALYVATKSDSAPVLQLTSETLVNNSRIDTTSNNYYYVDFDIDESDVGNVVQIGLFQNDQSSTYYFKLDYIVMSPTELIEKHAKRSLWNTSPNTRILKSSPR